MPFYPSIEEGFLRHLFKKEVYIPAIPFYLGLMDVNWDELLDAPGAEPGYGRVGPLYPADFDLDAGGIVTNAYTIHFPEATDDWSRAVRCFVLYESNYDIFLNAPLDDTYTVKKGEIPTFDAGALRVEMANYAMSMEYEIVLPGVTGHNAFSNYLKDKLLQHLFGMVPYTPPDIWVGLLLVDPGDSLTNTNCYEVLGNGTGYSRVYTDPMDWEVSITEAWNKEKIIFDQALEDWGTVVHFALFDTFSPLYAGNVLLHGPVTPPKIVAAGSIPNFDITSLGTGQKGEYDTLGIGFGVL